MKTFRTTFSPRRRSRKDECSFGRTGRFASHRLVNHDSDRDGNMTRIPNLNLTYDGLNRRVLKTTQSETREYYYNKNWQCLEEYSNETLQNSYLWGIRYLDDLICFKPDYTVALTDANFNVVAIASQSGLTERYTYTAFGTRTILNPSYDTRSTTLYPALTRTFTSQIFDPETNFLLYRNRFYSPTLGRFLTRDPIGYRSKDTNIYRYMFNGALNYTDPSGNSCIGCTPLQNCVLGCEEDCYKTYADCWYWYPGKWIKFTACVNSCPTFCENTDASLWAPFCEFISMDSSPAIRDGLNCLCGIASFADLFTNIPQIEVFDCLCNTITTIQETCKSSSKGLSYGLATLADCFSDKLQLRDTLLGEMGAFVGGFGNNVGGAIVGNVIGKHWLTSLISNAIGKTALYALENKLSQNSIFPKSQYCSCKRILGLD